MSQVFDFDGSFQTASPSIFTMETGGGGEGEEPVVEGSSTGLGGVGLSIETGLSRGTGLSPTAGLHKRVR